MQSKSWKQKREVSSLHTSSQCPVEKQWDQEKPQSTSHQDVPHHPMWITTATCNCLLLRPWSRVWAPTAFLHRTNHPSQNSYCVGLPALLAAINIVIPWDAPAFLPEAELPSFFGIALFPVPCYQGVTSGQGSTLFPRYLWKGFPQSSFGRDPKIPRTRSSFPVIHPTVSSSVLSSAPKYWAFTFQPHKLDTVD